MMFPFGLSAGFVDLGPKKPDHFHPDHSVPKRRGSRSSHPSGGGKKPNVAIAKTADGKLCIPGEAKPARHFISGDGTEYFRFQIRRQIGQGHSKLEREQRRTKNQERGTLVKANQRDFDAWFATLSPADRQFARAHGLHKPMPAEGFRRGAADPDALERADAEPIHEAEIRGTHNGRHVVASHHEQLDALEPPNLSVDLDHLTSAEVRSATDDFGDALQWAFECTIRTVGSSSLSSSSSSSPDHQLVELGNRSLVIIAALAPDLAAGVQINPDLARKFLAWFTRHEPNAHNFARTLARLAPTGELYRRTLEWIRRGRLRSDLGMRLQLIAYHLRPQLIDAATMREIGNPKNVTRQAVNKDAGNLRDTFDGVQAYIQRGTSTRVKCQASQLAAA